MDLIPRWLGWTLVCVLGLVSWSLLLVLWIRARELLQPFEPERLNCVCSPTLASLVCTAQHNTPNTNADSLSTSARDLTFSRSYTLSGPRGEVLLKWLATRFTSSHASRSEELNRKQGEQRSGTAKGYG